MVCSIQNTCRTPQHLTIPAPCWRQVGLYDPGDLVKLCYFTKRDYPEIRKILQLLFKLWFGVSQWVVRVAISHATPVDSKSRGVANAKS